MKIKNEREQFEEYLVNRYPVILRMFERNGESYILPSTNEAWELWKASREYEERYRLKTLTWCVYFPEGTDKGYIRSIVEKGDIFICNTSSFGFPTIWEGDMEAFTEDEVLEYIQPYLDKIGVLPLEVDVWENECDK